MSRKLKLIDKLLLFPAADDISLLVCSHYFLSRFEMQHIFLFSHLFTDTNQTQSMNDVGAFIIFKTIVGLYIMYICQPLLCWRVTKKHISLSPSAITYTRVYVMYYIMCMYPMLYFFSTSYRCIILPVTIAINCITIR